MVYVIIYRFYIGVLSLFYKINFRLITQKKSIPLYIKNKLIMNHRYYSTKANNNELLDPWFVTGFSDGESCFNILITKSKTNSIGWQVQVRFIIELNIKDTPPRGGGSPLRGDIGILYKIQNFFGVGKITFTQKVARYAVFGIKDICVILDHFENYPLQSAKQIDFYLWKNCINLILNRDHLSQKGLELVVAYKCAMNFGKSDNLRLSFPNMPPIEKPLLNNEDAPLNPSWVTGFMEGEGSFFIKIDKKTNKVRPGASIGLNEREKFLLIRINKLFKEIGSVYESPKHRFVEWKVFKTTSFDPLINHFVNNPLKGFKFYNFTMRNNKIN